MPEKARRASHARVSLREGADAEATRKASVLEAPPNTDATLEDVYPAHSKRNDWLRVGWRNRRHVEFRKLVTARVAAQDWAVGGRQKP